MAGFKVVYRADASLDSENRIAWEVGCPLQFEVIQISRNTDTGAAYLQGKLRNVSDRTVQSFKARITVEYEDGATEDVRFEPLDADVAAGATYELAPVELKQGNAASASGAVESAKLGNSVWQSSAAPVPLPIPAPIELSDAAAAERRIQVWGNSTPSPLPAQDIKAAAANHVEEHDGWWLCPCGQVNVSRGTCAKCNASLETLRKPSTEDEGALTAAAEKRQAETEQAANLKAKKAKKTRTFLLIGIIAVIAFIAIAVFAFQASQNARFEEGMSAFEAHDYAAAAATFESLGDHDDAQEWALYSQAMATYEAGAYIDAAVAFDSLGTFEDAASMCEQAKFMVSIAVWLNEPCAGSFYYAPYSANRPNGNWRSLDCTITLNADGACTVSIPQDANDYEAKAEGTNASQYFGEWKGTWDPSSRGLTLASFPSGEAWSVETTTYSQTSTSSGTRSINGPIIRSQTSEQKISFSVFD